MKMLDRIAASINETTMLFFIRALKPTNDLYILKLYDGIVRKMKTRIELN